MAGGLRRIRHAAAGTLRPFATGLRNPNGMALEPATGALLVADDVGNSVWRVSARR